MPRRPRPDALAQPMTTRVFTIVTPNVLLLDLAGPAEAFRLAQRAGAPLALHSW